MNEYKIMWLTEQQWEPANCCDFKLRGKNYLKDSIKIEVESTALSVLKCWYSRQPLHKSVDNAILIVNIIMNKSETIAVCFTKKEISFGKYALNFVENADINIIIDRLKLIPKIVKGPWIVRKAVPQVPILLAKHLKTFEYKPEKTANGYLSRIIDIDICSTKLATWISNLCSSYKKYLQAEIMLVIEGRDEDTLPEEALGCVRFKNINNKMLDEFAES